MTPEEKAKELAQICFPDELNVWARENVEAKNVELSCIAMYNWTVENVCKWLETNLHYGRRNGEILVNVGGLGANYANVDELIDALKKRNMTREEIVNSFEFQAAKSACQYNDRNSEQDNVTAYEEGAEYGYNFAVEKAYDWICGVRLDYYAEHEEEFLEDFKKAMAL